MFKSWWTEEKKYFLLIQVHTAITRTRQAAVLGEKKQGSVSELKDFGSRSSAEDFLALQGFIFFTFLPLFGLLTNPEVWDALRVGLWCVFFLHHSAPVGVCVSSDVLGASCSLCTAPGVLENLGTSSWNGQGKKLRQEGWRWISLLLVGSSGLFLFFPYYSSIPSVHPTQQTQERIFHFGEAIAGRKVSGFFSSGVSVCTPWKRDHWIWSMGLVPKRFCLQSHPQEIPSAPFEILTSSNKTAFALRCILEGWFGLFKPFFVVFPLSGCQKSANHLW